MTNNSSTILQWWRNFIPSAPTWTYIGAKQAWQGM